MTAITLLFTMAAIGLAEVTYLIRTRRMGEKAVCPIGGGCHEVLESKWNRLFSVRNDVLGWIFYLVVGIISAFLILEIQPLDAWLWLLRAMVALAVIMSIFFTYLQAVVIKQWCFWCLMSALTVAVMFLIIVVEFI
jgi:uncharacterized membrane protein